jgi:hypothetical protein
VPLVPIGPALLDAIRQRADGGKTSVEELNRLDTSAFVQKYILPADDVADRAIAFLNDCAPSAASGGVAAASVIPTSERVSIRLGASVLSNAARWHFRSRPAC